MYKPYKILMLITSMEYGGAETHLIELSKYLKANGADIKIISNSADGELFAKETSNAKIDHITAPFHSRKIFDMIKARKILKNTVKSYKPDVVHAHSRIPAFIASGICKKFKIPLVTSMHYQFKMSFLLKLATKWGDHSLYVSDDIKNYWQKYYNLKNGYMTKTVNGINAELFNADKNPVVGTPYMASADGHDIRQEFNISPDEKIILNVNRHQIHSSYSTRKLCEIAEDIYNHEKNTRIILVGDGELFNDIKAQADKVNEKLGFEYIIMAGRRADIYRFCKASDVNVDISRAALEAMACEKPVILCGDFGYLGRFTKEIADICEETNFTCRGIGYPENINDLLVNEILFTLDENNKDIVEADVKFGAEMIREKYSVKKMADDAYSVYQKAVLKYSEKYDFVLSGYYGYGNIGDDALMFSVISNILQKKEDMKICLLTKNPKKFQNMLDEYFANIKVKHRFNFLSVRNAIKKSQALVFGGGTLLNDNTSTRSFIYYSSLLKSAQKSGKKTILYANGIGPIYRDKNQKKAEKIAQNITLATMRDEKSYDSLINLGMDKNKIYQTADEVLTIKNNSYFNAYKKDFKEYISRDHSDKSGYVAVSVRKWKYMQPDFLDTFSAAIGVICREYNLIPVYIIMEPKNDKLISERLSQLNSGAYCINAGGDIEKVLAIIRSAEAVISIRLHTLIFAAAFGVPMVGISYDPKVKSFMDDIFDEDEYTVELTDFSKDKLTEKFGKLMSSKESVKEKINGETQKLCEKASSNAELFLKAMEVEHE